ncbi:MAG: ribosomal protein S18-alanine N-acetyltransferase [Lachnospiraceae bacterium]|nr:ribosomal protein S18-alanine N-acetyltransferase [Lachnospiraceae bacterium]
MIIRNMREADLPQVAEIEKQNFSIPWSLESFRESMMLEHTIYLVAEEKEIVTGYCGMYRVFNEGEIVNVAVDSKYRRRGVAKELLEQLLKESEALNVDNFFLEVRESNEAAINLYKKLGFTEAGIRRDFYEKPRENAIFMWKR